MKKSRLQWQSEQELKWHCLQYNAKQQYINRYPKTEQARRYAQDIDRIETALHLTTDAGTYEFLKKHVIFQNMPYERLGAVPIGRRQFYNLRQKFFNTLMRLRYDK